MQKKSPPKINFIYFGLYLACLIFLAASSIFTKAAFTESRLFFFLYSIGQATLETTFLILIATLLQRYAHRLVFLTFIGLSFVLLILHILDAIMDRILDLSVWGTISFVLDETFSNFLYLLDASGISLWIWLCLFGLVAALPFLGVALYRLTENIAKRYAFPLQFEACLMASVALPCALFLFDFSASRLIHPNTYTAFLQSLPWKATFLMPRHLVVVPSGALIAPQSEERVQKAIQNASKEIAHKPNIYLFIIESFRKDILSKETAPHLLSFFDPTQQESVTLSGANASHPSWFSIFHSQFSLYWNQLQKMGWSMGSPALQMLKALGYKIRLYSSAQLGYYGMEELLFGKDKGLIDSYQTFHHAPPLSAAEADAQALFKLEQDIQGDPSLQQGQVFIVFWDSTHFDYSWPKEWVPKFTPFAGEFAYFKAFYSQKKIEHIKNRYRNAVHYIDSLFGQFVQSLHPQDNAIVVVTGDHGEEFFDHGHLFHGSHLTEEQTKIPLFMHFPNQTMVHQAAPITQMDIFPSILDYLGVDSSSFLQGESALKVKQKPFAVISRFNAGRSPYEFCIHNGTHKLIAQFSNRKNIFSKNELRIVSLSTADDKIFPISPKETPDWVKQEFMPLLPYLFSDGTRER